MARTDQEVWYSPKSKQLPDLREEQCTPEAAERALKLLEGRWKMVIVFRLFAQPLLRFSELERAIPAVSQKMLIQQLRELERDGIVRRILHAQVPPKVEYGLTEVGQALYPALDELLKWARYREIKMGEAEG